MSNRELGVEMIYKALRAIRAFFGLTNPKTWGPFVETYEATRFDHAFTVSWSQCGEDLGLEKALNSIKNGKFVDVGAHHPSRFSVTKKLSKKDGRASTSRQIILC